MPKFPPRETTRAQRLLNITAASVLLVLSGPLMLLIALLVRLTSPGPALFVQERVGLNRRRNGFGPGASCRRVQDWGGKPFPIYKFRTMYVDSSNGDRQVWARPDDPRVTPFGQVLRRYRLDELPHFINVLRGEMNLVGPRPEQLLIFEQLRQQIAGYEDRQWVRPGITGWAQVNHHYDRSLEDVKIKLSLDLDYIRRQSVVEDLRIMLRTIPVVLSKRGAC